MSSGRFPVERWVWLVSGALTATSLSIALLVVSRASDAQAPAPGDAALREQGGKVFTEKCGKCHDSDAAKKLPDGSTLLERLAARKDPQARLATRLKSMSEQDARGVSLYLEQLIEQFRVEQTTSVKK
jgi:mono/diheme cytochrome c family protein